MEIIMLIDVHAHESEISTCCKASSHEVLTAARDAGIDGIVLVNHYAKKYIKDGDPSGFAKRYVEAYYKTKKLGDEMGMPVFFGIEITVEYQMYVHMLVYGVDTDFILRNPEIYDYSFEKLHKTVHESGGVLVQAHPFRGEKGYFAEGLVQDIRFIDALEVNSHLRYVLGNQFDRVSKIARDAGIILTSGGDYHADSPRPHCGMYLPDTVTDGISLGEYIKNTNSVELLINDYGEADGKKVFFERKK